MPQTKASKGQITLSVEEFDNLLWPAYRYCIGRHSYANSYIRDYWSIIKRNRDKFSKDRLAFLARDVRSYIAETLGWFDNFSVQDASNDRIVKDPYTLLAEYLIAYPYTNVYDTHFVINCVDCSVNIKPYHPRKPRYDADGEVIWQPKAGNPIDELSFVRDYILFANCIDSQFRCELAKDIYRETCDIVSAPIYEKGEWGFRWQRVDNWHLSPATEYIISVNKNEL